MRALLIALVACASPSPTPTPTPTPSPTPSPSPTPTPTPSPKATATAPRSCKVDQAALDACTKRGPDFIYNSEPDFGCMGRDPGPERRKKIEQERLARPCACMSPADYQERLRDCMTRP